jgi:mono/diheme cytochrome c family protein
MAVPELYTEILIAALASAGAMALIVVAVPYRRWRWWAIAAGLTVILYVVPSFRLLTVAAFPTTFWQSPTGFAADSVVAGARLFPEHCAACHGAGVRGDGPVAASLADKPADLTAEHLWEHSDGDLFWWISHGMGDGAMPGFADRLGERQRWNLIDFVHANGAAATAGADGWGHPVPTPDFVADCPGGDTPTLRDFAGRIIHLVFPGGDGERRVQELVTAEPTLRAAGIVTILVSGGELASPLCRADDPTIPAAYAILARRSPESLAGAEFLIDPAGRLRAHWSPGEAPDWRDTGTLQQRAAVLRQTKLAAPAAHGHVH